MMKRLIPIYFILLTVFGCQLNTEKNGPLKFAFVSDTHINGGENPRDDLIKTIDDINGMPDIDFIVLTGDITSMGSDKELQEAKSLLDSLKKPWYIIPGNHDTKWSESGNESFKRIFGSERFAFEKDGYLFLGCNSGPNMRMAPGLVPREDIVWLDSIVKNTGEQPVIFMNHYPLNESLANWYLVTDLLKQTNVQAALCGHGHRNKICDFEGIPGVMGRSNLTTNKDSAGYNLVTMTKDTMYFEERITGIKTKAPWHKIPLKNHQFEQDISNYSRPAYHINQKYDTLVREVWSIQENSDIGAGIVAKDDFAVFGNTNGWVKAIETGTGDELWKFKTNGKIYSTPSIKDDHVVIASTDGNIYNLKLSDGSLNWKVETKKSIVASPVVHENVVYIGSSEGKFRALALDNGNLVWEFDSVRGFVETQPLVDDYHVYFGDWGTNFYALNKITGELVWKWTNDKGRGYSPAACFPVKADDKVFIVAPDRFITVLHANTGEVVWRSNEHKGRESIGISDDQSLVYIKDMQDSVHAFYTDPDQMKLAWSVDCGFGYEISPSPIVEKDGLVFVPTQWGTIYAIDKDQQKVAWAYKMSNAIINNIYPLVDGSLLTTTMDGKVVKLNYENLVL